MNCQPDTSLDGTSDFGLVCFPASFLVSGGNHRRSVEEKASGSMSPVAVYMACTLVPGRSVVVPVGLSVRNVEAPLQVGLACYPSRYLCRLEDRLCRASRVLKSVSLRDVSVKLLGEGKR